eukprot:222052-Karenia_brevis.AAC.1
MATAKEEPRAPTKQPKAPPRHPQGTPGDIPRAPRKALPGILKSCPKIHHCACVDFKDIQISGFSGQHEA